MIFENKKEEDFLIVFIENKKWRVVRYLGLIIILFIVLQLPTEINIDFLKNTGVADPAKALVEINKSVVGIYLTCLLIIFINLFYLVPKLLFKNKFVLYLISITLLTVFKFCVEVAFSIHLTKLIPGDFYFTDISFYSFIASCTLASIFLIATTGYKIFKKWVYDSRQFAALKEATLKEELSNLKNQINPHFLFNTLNNLNTLIATNTTKASAVVLGLSDVLRFYLYESDKEKVLLKKDIEILQQVLELEKIRRDNFQFSLTTENNISGIMVPPFTFTNFVENAIKHSVDNTAFSFVHITFKIENQKLIFYCENSVPVIKSKSNFGGLGLQNIKRRLELIYENNFELQLKDEENTYSITLELPI